MDPIRRTPIYNPFNHTPNTETPHTLGRIYELDIAFESVEYVEGGDHCDWDLSVGDFRGKGTYAVSLRMACYVREW